jgi:prolyl 4-hydroxylase
MRTIEERQDLVHAKDENGWTPMHEGVRSGKVEVVEYLLNRGAEINERTHGGDGATPLWIAHNLHGKHHPVSLFLESFGGLNIEPEL